MGGAIANSIAVADELDLAGIWKRGDDLDATAANSDVLIDFSLPEANDEIVAAAVRNNIPLVCGVSGLSDEQITAIDSAATSIAVVYDRNMSLGVAVLENLVAQAVVSLGSGFGVEVHETHHVHKIDAPSGTALKLGEAIAAASGGKADDIHYEVERRGEVPGDHSVVLSSDTERLSLSHSVTTRQVFADGALHAARWIVSQPAGRYSMQDVLSEKTTDSL
jgi:4-hydroxy-tetrahydrodipicolinate reductase